MKKGRQDRIAETLTIKLYPFPSHEPTTGIHSGNPSNLFPYFTVPDYKPRLYYS